MAKYLKEVLKGVKSSTKVTNDLGGYKPKAGDEEDFAKKHEIEKHADRVGNGDDVYKGTTKHALAEPKEKNHGYKKPEDAKVNESKKAEDVSHNVDDEGRPLNEVSKSTLKSYTHAAVRDIASRQYKLGKGDLSDTRRLMNRRKGVDKAVEKLAKEEVEQIDELSTDTYHRAAKKAAKKAMWDPEGRSGKTFKKYSTMANKFRDKGMSQEKKEKAVKEEAINENGPVAPVPKHLDAHGIAKKFKGFVTGGGSTKTLNHYNTYVRLHAKKTGQHPDAINKEVRKHVKNMKEETVEEGAKVDRMVAHIKSSEKAAGKSDKKAENIAWATANKRGMLDNKNKVEEALSPKQKAHSHRVKNNPGPKGFTHDPSSNFEAPVHKVEVHATKDGKTHKIMHHLRSKDKHSAVFDSQLHYHKQGYKVHDAKHKGIVKESDTPMDITTAGNPSNSYPSYSADVNTGRNV